MHRRSIGTLQTLLFALTLVLPGNSGAADFTDVVLWGGLDTNLYHARIEDTDTQAELLARGGNGMLFGLSAGVRNLELGMYFVNRAFQTRTSVSGEGDTGAVDQPFAALDIPLLLRFGLWPVTLGAGIFYSAPLSSLMDASYGLALGPRVSLPLGFNIDLRMNLALNTDVRGARTSTLALLLGFDIF